MRGIFALLTVVFSVVALAFVHWEEHQLVPREPPPN
jgi:hypothetical protein